MRTNLATGKDRTQGVWVAYWSSKALGYIDSLYLVTGTTCNIKTKQNN